MDEKRTKKRRTQERRWNDAHIYLVERRKGDLWKYGSIALCILLLLNFGWLALR